MAPLVDALINAIDFKPPFALFGHSLGGLVAYEVARTLFERRRDEPAVLVVSGCAAPHLPRRRAPIHDAPNEILLEELELEGGPLTDALADDPELFELVLRAFRADCEVVETYEHAVDARPLACPIAAICGSDDGSVRDRIDAWSKWTSAAFGRRLAPGDHFYFRRDAGPLLELFATAVERTGG
jgi:surfactin synthase thioesterase subunit